MAHRLPPVILLFAGAACAGTEADGVPMVSTAQVDTIFAQFDGPNSPGCAVAVYRAGEILLARGYGMADIGRREAISPATVFDIASNAKQFTALAVLLAEDDGLLSLDDAVQPYVPELPTFEAPITIRNLLHNTSGLRDFGDLLELRGTGIEARIDRDEFFDLLRRQQSLNFAPGSRYMYSNTNWILLALIVERMAGIPFGDFLEERVLEPLGMRRTEIRISPRVTAPGLATTYTPLPDSGYRVNTAWALTTDIAGMGFLHTTVEDLAAWDGAFYGGGPNGESIAERLYERGRLNSGEPTFYARGVMHGRYLRLPATFHGGQGGGSSELIRFPTHRLSVAVLCNLYHTAVDSRDLALQVAALYLPKTDSVITRVPRVAGDPTPSEFAGLYWIPEQARRAEFVARSGILVEVSDDVEYPLTHLGDGAFQDAWESITFRRDGSGGEGIHRATGEQYRLVRWPASPPAFDPTDYAGAYRSDDLGLAWTFVARGEDLFLERASARSMRVESAYVDAFTIPDALLEFVRGVDGRVSGLSVSTARIVHLGFSREHGGET